MKRVLTMMFVSTLDDPRHPRRVIYTITLWLNNPWEVVNFRIIRDHQS